jgi:glycosyltransferase involved in cell wall biosynthesis
VAEQLKMLLDAGISTKVIVSGDCPDEERFGIYLDKRVEWIKIVNKIDGRDMILYDYANEQQCIHDTFEAEADVIAEDFVKHLQDVRVCILHDILSDGWHLVHNIALRKASSKLPEVKFISFSHSEPEIKPSESQWPFSARFMSLTHTEYAYPTESGIIRMSRQFGVTPESCHVVYNCLDPADFASTEVTKVFENIDLVKADVVIIYPGRLNSLKNFDKVAAFGGVIRSLSGKNVKIVFCDYPSKDAEKEKIIIKMEGFKYGLDIKDMLFTSDIGFSDGFPRKGVLELFTMSDLFINPSSTESFGMTVIEAASRGNILVLNSSVPAFRELGDLLGAYFLKTDIDQFAITSETYNPNQTISMAEDAMNILKLLKDNPVINAKNTVRKMFSPHWVWKNQLKPIIDRILE